MFNVLKKQIVEFLLTSVELVVKMVRNLSLPRVDRNAEEGYQIIHNSRQSVQSADDVERWN